MLPAMCMEKAMGWTNSQTIWDVRSSTRKRVICWPANEFVCVAAGGGVGVWTWMKEH